MPEGADLPWARHRLYALLGQLLVEGWSEAIAPTVEALPALGELLPPVGAREPLEVEHQRWFSRELAPYESVFLDPKGQLGGPVTSAVQLDHVAVGFRPGRTDVEADHLGLELACMGHLCAAQAEALEDGETDKAASLAKRQQELLGRHLIRWLPALSVAVSEGFWGTVVELALELVASHAAGGGEAPPLPGMRGDPPSDARAWARVLSRPGVSGWVVTWSQIHAAAERSGVPCGFGPSKRQALANLLDSPVGRQAVVREVERFAAALQVRGERLSLPVERWVCAARGTAESLDRLG